MLGDLFAIHGWWWLHGFLVGGMSAAAGMFVVLKVLKGPIERSIQRSIDVEVHRRTLSLGGERDRLVG